MEEIKSGWYYSLDHGQLCQVIKAQPHWVETTCHVWLIGRNSVVSIPASRLKSLESAGTGSPDDIAYITTDRAHQFLTVASKISENVLYENPKLFMWYD